jgi:hypothetical protein
MNIDQTLQLLLILLEKLKTANAIFRFKPKAGSRCIVLQHVVVMDADVAGRKIFRPATLTNCVRHQNTVEALSADSGFCCLGSRP